MALPADLSHLTASGYYGSRGAANFATNLVEPSYLSTIGELFPGGGKAKLVQLLSMFKKDKETNDMFYWFNRHWVNKGGAGVVWLNALLTVLPVNGTAYAAGTVVFVQVSAMMASYFRPKHEVILRKRYQPEYDVHGHVLAVTVAGANSFLTVQLFTNAPAVAGERGLTWVDIVERLGNVNEDGSYIPDAVALDPTKYENYMHTFRNPVDLTRHAKLAKLHGSEKAEVIENRWCFRDHTEDIERTFMNGVGDQTVLNGHRLTKMWGIIPYLRANVPANEVNFYSSVDPAYAAQTWGDVGALFFDSNLENVWHYNPPESEINCYCGSGFLGGVDRMVKATHDIHLTPGAAAGGVRVMRYYSPYGVVNFVPYPLFTESETFRFSGLFLNPDNITMVEMTPTRLKNDTGQEEAGTIGYDGSRKEWLSDLSLRINFPQSFYLMHGVGMNNRTAP